MTQRNRTIAIVGGVVLVIVLILGIALLASSGGDDDTPTTAAPAETSQPADGEGEADGTGDESGDTGDTGDDASEAGGETRPVTVTGDPLPPLESPDDPAVGTQAPVLEGEDFDGSPITIGDPDAGEPTLVVFLAHWCPHCNDEIPELIALDEQGRLPDGLNVVGVSTAATPEGENYPPSEWIDEKGWPWPIMVDSAEADALIAYGGTGFPFAVVLDENGVVLARKTGSGSADQIAEWIETVLG